MTERKPDFQTEIDVRDYEIDSQGRAHHARIVEWTEHARALFLKARGYTYSKLVEDGLHLVISSLDVSFKHSIYPDERLTIQMWVEREKSRLIFTQHIVDLPSGSVRVVAKTSVAAVRNGRATRGEFFDELLAPRSED